MKNNELENLAVIMRAGSRGVKKAQEENRRMGLASVYSKNGRLYYELPDGTITMEKPREKQAS